MVLYISFVMRWTVWVEEGGGGLGGYVIEPWAVIHGKAGQRYKLGFNLCQLYCFKVARVIVRILMKKSRGIGKTLYCTLCHVHYSRISCRMKPAGICGYYCSGLLSNSMDR